jgi:hypothetical protein
MFCSSYFLYLYLASSFGQCEGEAVGKQTGVKETRLQKKEFERFFVVPFPE